MPPLQRDGMTHLILFGALLMLPNAHAGWVTKLYDRWAASVPLAPDVDAEFVPRENLERDLGRLLIKRNWGLSSKDDPLWIVEIQDELARRDRLLDPCRQVLDDESLVKVQSSKTLARRMNRPPRNISRGKGASWPAQSS